MVVYVATIVGVTVKAVPWWDCHRRLLPSSRTAANRRYYPEEQGARFRLKRVYPGLRWHEADCRISRHRQQPDFKHQRNVLEDFCVVRGLPHVEGLEEVRDEVWSKEIPAIGTL
jgi:DNA-binding transcriptional MerR regulator